jgi:NAD(P)H-dependent flavin oxidoreductase YrpB (nitropropane dioxygenase family)
MLITPFTEVFGVEQPVVCGAMPATGTAELVAAVADAGALGFLGVPGGAAPGDLARQITRCRELTERPFGVDVTVLSSNDPAPHAAYRDVIIGAGIPVVATSGSEPEPHLLAFHAAGIKIVHRAVTVGHARRAQDLGADAVMIDGLEAAGRAGAGEIDGLAFIAAAADQLTVPIIAGGRLADGRGLVAALALGASAINIGTRFLGRSQGLIDDVTSCGEVVARIVDEAEDIITGRLAGLVTLPGAGPQRRSSHAEPASETKLETALEAAWEAAP